MNRLLTLALVICAAAPGVAQTYIHTHAGTPAAAPAVNNYLAPVGDVDADGHADYALAGSTGETVSVHSGATGAFLFDVFTMAQPFYHTRSYAFAGAGDVNDDGHDDVIVGFGPGAGGAGGIFFPDPESVFVFSGADGSVLHMLTGPQLPPNGEAFGAAVAGLGDIDGDGFGDFAVGVPEAEGSHNAYYAGRVELRSGADASLLASLSGGANDRYGTSLAPAGDVDGDGTPDLLVGHAANGASADVISGADFSLLATHTISQAVASSPTSGGYYVRGLNVTGGGDVDADGVPDVVIGAFNESGGGIVEAFSGATGATIHQLSGSPGDHFGWNVDLGDVNGDGHADLAVSTWNLTTGQNDVTLHSGLTGDVVLSTAGLSSNLTEVAIAGDVDGDGHSDVIVGRDVSQTGSAFFGVVRGGPWLGAGAQSHVGSHVGAPVDVLRVAGSTGGSSRRVDLAVGQPFIVQLQQPPSNPQPADFAIFGALFAPPETHFFTVPGVVGAMTVAPAPLAPWAAPYLFTLAASTPVPGALAATPPAPYFGFAPAGLPVAIDFALQGVVFDDTNRIAATNGILVRVR